VQFEHGKPSQIRQWYSQFFNFLLEFDEFEEAEAIVAVLVVLINESFRLRLIEAQLSFEHWERLVSRYVAPFLQVVLTKFGPDVSGTTQHNTRQCIVYYAGVLCNDYNSAKEVNVVFIGINPGELGGVATRPDFGVGVVGSPCYYDVLF